MKDCFIQWWGRDGIEIEEPVVCSISGVKVYTCGRHGFNVYGKGSADGTATVFSSCYAAGCRAAGYRINQMAYSTWDSCAADSLGIGYEVADSNGLTFNSCGMEAPYDFSSLNAGYPGYAWKISGSRNLVVNTPFMLQNIGTAFWVTDASNSIIVNGLYEGSPGNPDSPPNDPTYSILVDAGCEVTLNRYTVTTPVSLNAAAVTIPQVPEATEYVTAGTYYYDIPIGAKVLEVTLMSGGGGGGSGRRGAAGNGSMWWWRRGQQRHLRRSTWMSPN